ncbi:pirin family domain protein [Burkholderia pseudomallei MSHR5492]|nr:pirin family domain protein [Burkholderia pseudomallei MSHR7504]KGS16839.1 pirin family domain protein [Burkholderia pseudomallei MSHR4378]KGS35047.1 pirin family domain protein [Burkholderia pseudomallei ABCPW 107]KGS36858.1 pirin family domain protein [Burkholderia pseudomallei MSHR5492]KGX67014.1 pirin family domain protein [Burkholderia pseudomallei TSV28]
MLIEKLARLGQRELARRALQQAHAERRLELGESPRQARFRDAEHAFRGREAAVLDHLREVHQVVQVMCVDSHFIVPIPQRSIANRADLIGNSLNIIALRCKNNAISRHSKSLP